MRRRILLCGVTALIGPTALHAQDVPDGSAAAIGGPAPTAAATSQDDPIVVTGSLIRGTSFQPSSPVDVLDRKDFEERASTSVAKYLADLPYNVNAVTVPAGGGATAFPGGGSVNLRNLGDGATLILLNSKRQTRLPREASTVDVNGLVPQIMIDRVEILKDGASSLYGSDAVGGVVNIFTRDKFDGAEIRAQTSIVTETGKQETRFGGLFGGSFGDTHVTVGLEYNIRDQLFPEDQPWSNILNLSTPWNPGRFVIPRRNAAGVVGTATTRVLDEGCGVTQQTYFFAAGTPNVASDACYYNFYPDSGLVTAENRVQSYLVLTHDFEPWLKLRLEGGYQKAHTYASTSTSASINVIPAITVPGDNPGLARADAERVSNGKAPVYFARNAAGQQIYAVPNGPGSTIPLRDASGRVVLTTSPIVAGNGIPFYEDVVFEGRILGSQCGLPTNNSLAPGECARRSHAEDINDALRFVGGFSGDVGHGWFYETTFTYSKITERNDAQNNNVLIPQLRQALAGFGGPQCNALIAGQQPGTGNCYYFNPFNNAIYAKEGTAAANRQDVIDWLMPSLFDYYETSESVIDAYATGPLFDLPGGPLNLAFGMQYRKDTWAVDFDAAKNAGIVETGSVSTDTSATQDALAFFGELAAPVFDNPIGQLNVNASLRHERFQGSATTDPKVGATYSAPGRWLTLRGSYGTSYLQPTLFQRFTQSSGLANISDTGPGLRGPDAIRRITTLFEGNQDLRPQTSTSYAFGALIKPMKGLRFDIGYWNYTFSQRIASENVQALVTANDPAKVIRDAQNNVVFVKPSYINLSGLKTSGFDFEAAYNVEIGTLGRLSLSAIATYVPHFQLQATPTSAYVETAGNRNTVVTGGTLSPKWRGLGRISWEKGPHTFSTAINYYGGVGNDQIVRTPGEVKQPEDNYLSGTTTFDFTYSYDFGDLWKLHGSNITVGIRNAFNNSPEHPKYDQPLFVDPRGRIAFLRLVTGF
ncbi:MAG: TonB-dependent receptor plug domain-containing protein [Paracoccaceae bacterium]